MKKMGSIVALFVGFLWAFQVSAEATFLWCAATAAHQIEGGNTESDWWDWEHLPGKIKNGESSHPACDHWNRIDQDIELLKNLGTNAYRFSVEWAKIEPKEGVWDQTALDHYKDEISKLQQAGIEPLVTLHHFTLPRWLREKGGWEWEGAPAAFANFAKKVQEEAGPRVKFWTTFNEPMVHLTLGYSVGIVPPGKKEKLSALVPPLLGLLKAHKEAYRVLHDYADHHSGEILVGMAHHLRIFDAASWWNPADKLAAHWIDQSFNWAIPEALETGRIKVWIPTQVQLDLKMEGLEKTQDYFGLNYYTRDMVKVDTRDPNGFKFLVKAGSETNDMGWEIYPEGFYRILKAAHERVKDKPILITENGVADSKDVKRKVFIEEHLKAMDKARKDGVPVIGYCHWSLLDNFEWVEGYGPRFGLYEVNYETQDRTLRSSGEWYRDYVGSHPN